jgi:hypothetical protein
VGDRRFLDVLASVGLPPAPPEFTVLSLDAIERPLTCAPANRSVDLIAGGCCSTATALFHPGRASSSF